jgi:hypothetical protein
LKKSILITLCFLCLYGCATTDPERLERAKKYEERSQKANQRASEIGSRAGTPDNIEYMERAYDESAYYGKEARDEKYTNTWGEFFLGAIVLLISIAFK